MAMITTSVEETMKAVLDEARRLDKLGKLDRDALNPQLRAVLDRENGQNIFQRLGDMVMRRGGVNRFNMTVKADSQPVVQAQPGVMVRRVAAIF
jgi:hypothetical protein